MAHGERSMKDAAVQEHLQDLMKTVDEMNAVLGQVSKQFYQVYNADIVHFVQGPFDQDQFERLLAEWTTICNQPFEEVESPSLRRVLQYVHGSTPLRIPSADTIRRRVLELGQGALYETKELIRVSSAT